MSHEFITKDFALRLKEGVTQEKKRAQSTLKTSANFYRQYKSHDVIIVVDLIILNYNLYIFCVYAIYTITKVMKVKRFNQLKTAWKWCEHKTKESVGELDLPVINV